MPRERNLVQGTVCFYAARLSNPLRMSVALAHSMRGQQWADDPAAIAAMQGKVPETVGACYDLIKQDMLKGPWVMGTSYTICDPYFFTFAQWLEDDGV